jgi:hypothetical protein
LLLKPVNYILSIERKMKLNPRYESPLQGTLAGFEHPFDRDLNPSNRGVVLSNLNRNRLFNEKDRGITVWLFSLIDINSKNREFSGRHYIIKQGFVNDLKNTGVSDPVLSVIKKNRFGAGKQQNHC